MKKTSFKIPGTSPLCVVGLGPQWVGGEGFLFCRGKKKKRAKSEKRKKKTGREMERMWEVRWEWVWDSGDDQSWPPTGAVNQATIEAANYREITHLALLPRFAAGTEDGWWWWGERYSLVSSFGPILYLWIIYQSSPIISIWINLQSPDLNLKYPNVVLLWYRLLVSIWSNVFSDIWRQLKSIHLMLKQASAWRHGHRLPATTSWNPWL